MAPPRRKREKANERRYYKIGLPEDVAARIEAKAKAEGRPMNRIVINELAAIPNLEKTSELAQQVRDLDVILAQYGARITWHNLSDDLLAAVDAILAAAAKGDILDAAVDRLSAVRKTMLHHEREGREPHK